VIDARRAKAREGTCFLPVRDDRVEVIDDARRAKAREGTEIATLLPSFFDGTAVPTPRWSRARRCHRDIFAESRDLQHFCV